MENNKRKITLYDIVAVGLLAAFVFIATFFFKIKIPTPGGSTMVKLGNGICLLAGTLLGGWRGGLAAVGKTDTVHGRGRVRRQAFPRLQLTRRQ